VENSGALDLLEPVPARTNPVAISILPSEKFAYVANLG